MVSLPSGAKEAGCHLSGWPQITLTRGHLEGRRKSKRMCVVRGDLAWIRYSRLTGFAGKQEILESRLSGYRGIRESRIRGIRKSGTFGGSGNLRIRGSTGRRGIGDRDLRNTGNSGTRGIAEYVGWGTLEIGGNRGIR